MRALMTCLAAVLMSCGAPRREAPKALASGRASLESSEPAKREKAAWDLGQLGLAELPEGATESAAALSIREAAVSSLLPVVLDPEPSVRRAAVEALGKTGGANVDDSLLSASTDVD